MEGERINKEEGHGLIWVYCRSAFSHTVSMFGHGYGYRG